MVEPGKFTEKATELAGQAAEAAGPLVDKAKEVAEQVAEKAAPIVEKAGELAAKGVSAAAEGIDKVTGGKYAEQLSTMSAKIEDVLERKED